MDPDTASRHARTSDATHRQDDSHTNTVRLEAQRPSKGDLSEQAMERHLPGPLSFDALDRTVPEEVLTLTTHGDREEQATTPAEHPSYINYDKTYFTDHQRRAPSSSSPSSPSSLAKLDDNLASLPFLTTTSPPRYMTRGSLGSVAFGMSGFPGDQSSNGAAAHDDEGSASYSSARTRTQSSATLQPDRRQLHRFPSSHSVNHPHTSPGRGKLVGLEDSPDLQQVEQQLLQGVQNLTHSPEVASSRLMEAELPPGYPDSPDTSSRTLFSKKRAPPAPLDLSPPRPGWMRTNEQHPAIQQQDEDRPQHAPQQPHSSSPLNSTLGSRSTFDASFSTITPSSSSASSIKPSTYTGLGLGLPFSSSATSDSLSSLPSSSSQDGFHEHTRNVTAPPSASSSITSPSHPVLRKPRSSSQVSQMSKSGSTSFLGSPESPPSQMDRRGLVGLGELTTPRWTASLHERRWAHQNNAQSPSQHHHRAPVPSLSNHDGGSEDAAENWEGAVLGSYASDSENLPYETQYHSFSDLAGTASSNTDNGYVSTSQSSSSYSLGAMSMPETGSSGSSEAGASRTVYYTPSLTAHHKGDGEHVNGSAEAGSQRFPRQHSFGFPQAQASSAERRGKDSQGTLRGTNDLRSTSTGRALDKTVSASNLPVARSTSRESSASLSTSSRPVSQQRRQEQTREVPSYMRSTAASSSRRSSVGSLSEAVRKTRGASHNPNDDPGAATRTPQLYTKTRTSSPTSSSGHTSRMTPRNSHSRNPSVTSTTKRSAPPPIHTGKTSQHHNGYSTGATPLSGHRTASAHHSPSAIAHSILRSTRASQVEGFDMTSFAAKDEATAEALRKLDGISATSSPRMSRALSGSSTKTAASYTMRDATDNVQQTGVEVTPRKTSAGSTLSRENSKASRSSPARSRSNSIARKVTSKAQSSITSTSGVSDQATVRGNDYGSMTNRPVQATNTTTSRPSSDRHEPSSASLVYSGVAGLRKQPLSSSISAPALAAIAASASASQGSPLGSPKSPNTSTSNATFISPAPPIAPTIRRSSNARPISTGAGGSAIGMTSATGDVPPTPSLSSQRSSSASLAFGTSISGSRDSTSATSISAHGSPAHGRSSKGRRGSTSSEVSSVHSPVDATITGEFGELQDLHSQKAIPPVPPLPKDWESYRPANASDASQPNSAKDLQFKKDDTVTRSPALPSASDNLASPGSRRVSMEKPLGPRPLRAVSGSSSMHAQDQATSPAPLPQQHSNQSAPPDRTGVASKTPTKPKWSLSNALGIHKSPSALPSSSSTSSLGSKRFMEKSISHNDLSTVESASGASSRSHRHSVFGGSYGAKLPKRKLSSVPDIQALSRTTPKSSSSLSASGVPVIEQPGRHRQHSVRERQRTESLSSNSTGNTTAATGAPSVVTTSPGRSRSSLLSPRRTPSGIPFFSRRPSASALHAETTTPSLPTSPRITARTAGNATPSTPKSTHTSEEKAGRKSILGINLFSRGSARKSFGVADADRNMPASPKTSSQYSHASTSSAMSPTTSEHPDEFGVKTTSHTRRSSVSAKASSLIGRKRGKTLPSNAEPPHRPQPVALPPMQMNALPEATVSRVQHMTADDGSATPSNKRPLPVPPRSLRNARQNDAANKGALPTITGSPSVVNVGSSAPNEVPARMSPKPATPTRIPRPVGGGSRSRGPSPAQAVPAQDAEQKTELAIAGTAEPPPRRGSIAPGSGLSSSVPQHSSSALLSVQDAAQPSSSESSSTADHTPSPSDDTPSSSIQRSRYTSTTTLSPAVTALLPQGSTAGKNAARGSSQAVAPATAKAEKRVSLLGSDKESRLAKTSLKDGQPVSSSRLLGKTQSMPSSSISQSTPRGATKGSEAATPLSVSKRHISLNEGLPVAKSSRSLASKLSIPSRISKSTATSAHSPSPVPSEGAGGARSTASSRYGTPIGEDELKGDEEMMEFVNRQRAKKKATGMSSDEIDRLFDFPEPIDPRPSLTPQEALHIYSDRLSEYEKEEILDYQEVYYVGETSLKNMATKQNAALNHGYDDERGDFLVVEHDHILFRYEIIDVLGKGSFGQVLRCRDHRTGEMVALKVIRNKKRFHHQALVEIKVLENLKRWDPEEKNCLLKICDSFSFRGHLCITTELLSINLYELIKANSFRGFSTTLIRRFTIQILAALSLLRHHRVVHCDLKPENLLLKHPAKSAVKVIDFGSSCFENEKVYTYIQSRFYRSPEVILGMNYHMAIDMWSLGCILAEMYTGYPIFPGENEASQLACIMEVLGVPDKHIVDRSSRKKLFFDSSGAPRPVVDSKGRRRRPGAKSLSSVLKCDDELFVDFIAKCLTWDPDRRLKPGPALRHPYCARSRQLGPSAANLTSSSRASSSSASSRALAKSSSTSKVAAKNGGGAPISTPRRLEKKTSSSIYATPSSSTHTLSSTAPSTAPVQRTRVYSNAVVPSTGGPVPSPHYTSHRIHGK